jgi:TorA maturation chaperone TorD
MLAATVGARPTNLAEEELLRARLYALLARFLASPPDAALLQFAAKLHGDDSEIGQAIGAFARAAAAITPAEAAEEFQDLFIGVGRGELLPYGSYYLTGFLEERPLAKLRQDLAPLGIVRAEGNPEPEDHIASMCEIMAGLIDGEFGAPVDLVTQQKIFDTHLAPWAGRFFADLEAANAARLYAPIGCLGRLFMAIEAMAFELAA